MSSEKCQPQRVWTSAQNGEFISEGAYFIFLTSYFFKIYTDALNFFIVYFTILLWSRWLNMAKL